MSKVEFQISTEDVGARLDHVVAKAAGVSVQRAKEMLGEGRVRLGHKRPKKGDRAKAGDTLHIELPSPEGPVPEPELPLAVVYEDEWLLALDKPAGISMHPLEPGEKGTLANAVIARYPEVIDASPEERCPGLIHRLDRDTSGVVLWAKKREAFDAIRAQFAARTVEKRYFALVEGFVEGAGILEIPLAHDPSDHRKMLATPYPAEAEALKARPATTKYRAMGLGDDATLLDVEIPTGVMHQIRAHFSFTGHPVVSDELYGAALVEGFGRHALHAASIAFEHPNGSGPLRLSARLPEELRALLDRHGIGVPAGF